jgi:hypothetical protein
MFALCEDGFTLVWLGSHVLHQGKTWPHTALYVRKYFIEPIEDEL